MTQLGVKREEYPDEGALYHVLTDYFFILLPVVVVVLVRSFHGLLREVARGADLSFASSVLFGQTIARLVAGVVRAGYRGSWRVSSFLITAVLVLGLVPSVVMLVSALSAPAPSLLLEVLQVAWFVLGSAVYIWLAHLGETLVSERS